MLHKYEWVTSCTEQLVLHEGAALSNILLQKEAEARRLQVRITKAQVYCICVLQCGALCCSVLQFGVLCCSVRIIKAQVCYIVCCSVLQCGVVCCSMVQRVAVWYNVLQCPHYQGSGILHLCVAVWCNVLQCGIMCCSVGIIKFQISCIVCCGVLQCGAVCCRLLPSVAVWCSVVQRVAVWCNVLQCSHYQHSGALHRVLQCAAV